MSNIDQSKIEATLAKKMSNIFGFKKVSFSAPGPALEQEAIFISIQSCKGALKKRLYTAKVTGKFRVFVNADKMPLGHILKKISSASADDTKDLFFYEIEENVENYQNLVERSASFVYFFSSQYNPDDGTLGSVTLNLETNNG